MKEYKRLKDPIYGYIQIPKAYMTEIVDSATFQRLRRIIQTSYSPLYSSAVHNRFVHSLGVYHLGAIAAETLCREIALCVADFPKQTLEEISQTFLFEYSCAMKSHFRKSGNQMSGKWKSSYASLLA